MHLKHALTPQARRLIKHLPPDPSREARARLQFLDYHQSHGRNVSLTCRRFGISRPTFYRWYRRYDPHNLRSLEDRPNTPRHFRQPTWTAEIREAVRAKREQYPSWGKDKLAVLLRRDGLTVSVSMVGRIIKRLKHTGELVEPPRFAISVRKPG